MEDYYPRLLLIHARSKRGVSGFDFEELREIAKEHWPKMAAEWIERITRRAIEQRGTGQRRIDPKTVDLQHPTKREAQMTTLTTGRLKDWLRKQLRAEPTIDNDELERRANQEFGASKVSRRSLGQTAGFIRRELDDAQPSTNGARPPAPSPSAAEAEPTPATDATEGEGEGPSVQLPPSPPADKPKRDSPPTLAKVDVRDDVLPELSVEKSLRTPGRMDVRVTVTGVPAALALRIGAALANAAEYELREGEAA